MARHAEIRIGLAVDKTSIILSLTGTKAYPTAIFLRAMLRTLGPSYAQDYYKRLTQPLFGKCMVK